MKFIKLFSAGQDFIILSDSSDIDSLNTEDIIMLCDRQKGIGAQGILSFCQKNAKTSQIRGFLQNGEVMQDFSTASVCAAFALFSEKRLTHQEFSAENHAFFTVSESFSEKSGTIYCDMGKADFNLKYPAEERKTQLGNRILTLTAAQLHALHTLHFSECKDKLNLSYLGEKVSVNSLFQKKADLILAEEREDSIDIDYYGKAFTTPSLSSFGFTALCACKTGRAEYDKEIKITHKSNEAYAVCKKDGNIMMRCEVREVFRGEI